MNRYPDYHMKMVGDRVRVWQRGYEIEEYSLEEVEDALVFEQDEQRSFVLSRAYQFILEHVNGQTTE